MVEAGVRCVTLNFGRWDFHSNNFSEFKNTHGPLFDQGMSALVEDLAARGLDQDVSVVAWGEFGRTPVINKDAGRDHWPQVGCALLAGGGMKTGQVIGATDRLGGEPVRRPVHFGEVLATLYQQLGLDLNRTTLNDLTGRPHYLVDGFQPMREADLTQFCGSSYWWGVTLQTVTVWRQALAVDPNNDGARRLHIVNGQEPFFRPAQRKAWSKAQDSERCAKIAAPRRGNATEGVP